MLSNLAKVTQLELGGSRTQSQGCLTLTRDAKLPLFSPGLLGAWGSLLGLPQDNILLNTQANPNWVSVQLAPSGMPLFI